MTIPYVYLVKWSSTGVWYYGRRTAKNCNPSDFWVTYYTSSKYVKEYIKLHGQPDIIKIRKTFTDAQSCENWETRFLAKTNAPKNPYSLNRSYATSKMNSTGMCPAKEKHSNVSLGLISLDDPRWKSGEIVGVNKFVKQEKISKQKRNTIMAKDKNGVFIGNVHKDDPRWKTGEITFVRTGCTQTDASKEKNKQSNQNRVTVLTPEGKTIKVSRDDPLYLNGTYKGVSSGRVWVNDGKHSKTIRKEELGIFVLDGWVKGRLM